MDYLNPAILEARESPLKVVNHEDGSTTEFYAIIEVKQLNLNNTENSPKSTLSYKTLINTNQTLNLNMSLYCLDWHLLDWFI